MEEADSQLAQELDRREKALLKLQEQKEFERLQVRMGVFLFVSRSKVTEVLCTGTLRLLMDVLILCSVQWSL